MKKPLLVASIVSLLFFAGIIFDTPDIIRNYPDPNLSYQWTYYYVPTWNKIILPIFAFLIFITGVWFAERKKLNTKRSTFLFLLFLLTSTLLIQLSLVAFSRFGLGVLFRRMVDPGINGYFSASMVITDPLKYIQTYPEIITSFFQHAPTHPPGISLMFYFLTETFRNLPNQTASIISFIEQLNIDDAKYLWGSLDNAQRLAGLSAGFIAHIFSLFALVPLYFLTRKLFSTITAVRTTALYALVPSVVFFPPFFDPFYSFFPILSVYFLTKCFKDKKPIFGFVSGFIFSIGLFFSYSILIVAGLVGVFAFLNIKKLYNILKVLKLFIAGVFTPILFYYLFDFRLHEAFFASTAIATHRVREYLPSVFFNMYDFFIFLGIPLAIIFISASLAMFKTKKTSRLVKQSLIAVWITLFAFTLSGVTRGETGRIWLPIMFVPVGILAYYLTNIKKSQTFQFAIFLLLIFIQLILFEEFWVPVW